ncbi:MAG TPA: hypothetical protein VE967_14325, partial [Gemmatimonadaceae bacterium]|nr:hypothetical protein [Gemmatimonadaceae bacterium]
ADPGFDQIALIDAKGKVTRSVEMPMLRPTLSERRKFPVFSSMEALARYADGSMLVRGLGQEDYFSTPEFDSTAAHLFRVQASGIITSSVARYTPDAFVTFQQGNKGPRRSVPLQNRTIWNVSSDGMRIGIIAAAMSGRDSATFGVVVLSERGDTIYSRRYPFKPERITAHSRDSALAQTNRPPQGVSPEEMRAALEKQMPVFYPPVRSAFFGRDRTLWLNLTRSSQDSLYTRLILDPAGVPIGTVAVPPNSIIVAGDRAHVWTIEREGNMVGSIARYRLVPAKR